MNNGAYFYVDQNNGLWIDLDYVTDADEIRAAMAERGHCTHDTDLDELKVSSIFGALAQAFYRKPRLDLAGFIAARDDCLRYNLDMQAVADYLGWLEIGLGLDRHWSVSYFEDAYMGQYASRVAFAEHRVEELDLLAGVPCKLRRCFNYFAYANDLFESDFYMSQNGHVFDTAYA